mmetsp:Transcript_60226/g.131925  ORF Transcript_60226/g.131925 Transcript_60226/m.131925 type:complete len:232 (-) Transcript_60226:21-716(-)
MQRCEMIFSRLKLVANSGMAEASHSRGCSCRSSDPNSRLSASSCSRGIARWLAQRRSSKAWRALSTTSQEALEAFEMARCCFEIQSSSLLSLAPGPASANSTAASKAILLAPKAWKSTAPANSDPSTGAIKDANAGKRVVSWVFRTSRSCCLVPPASTPSRKRMPRHLTGLTTSVLRLFGRSSTSPQSPAAGPCRGNFRASRSASHPLSALVARSFLEAESKSPHICCDLI